MSGEDLSIFATALEMLAIKAFWGHGSDSTASHYPGSVCGRT